MAALCDVFCLRINAFKLVFWHIYIYKSEVVLCPSVKAQEVVRQAKKTPNVRKALHGIVTCSCMHAYVQCRLLILS